MKIVWQITRILFITFILMEICIRFLSVRNKHIESFLNKPSRFLVPFDVPANRLEPPPPPDLYRVYDPQLGWNVGPNGKDEPLYYSDAHGFRISKKDYSATAKPKPTSKQLGVIALGDSFTHGDEVKYEDSWPAILQEMTGLSVLNLGVGGYGVDQVVLKYKELDLKSQHVLLGIIEGDMERSLALIYNFRGGGVKTKPIFEFKEEGVQLFNQPALEESEVIQEFKKGVQSDFFKHARNYHPLFFKRTVFDFFYTIRLLKNLKVRQDLRLHQPIYRTDDERLDYIMKILNYLKGLVEERDSNLTVLLLGSRNTFADRKKIDAPWELFEKKLRESGIQYLNVADTLYKVYEKDKDSIINSTGVHYTPYANRLVAQQIVDTGLLTKEK